MSASDREAAQARRDQVSAMWADRRERWSAYNASQTYMGWSRAKSGAWHSRDQVWTIVGPMGDSRYWLYRNHVRFISAGDSDPVATMTPGDAMAEAWRAIR